jgi:hypothetical protein
VTGFCFAVDVIARYSGFKRNDRGAMMKSYCIVEKYGVSGPTNEVHLGTTTLSSCSAIIMYNATTSMLGLFHYGALSLTGTGVMPMIRQMFNDLQPTQMILWPANVVDQGYGSVELERQSVLLDNAKVRQFLLLLITTGCTLEQKKDETFPGVRVDSGTLVFEAVSYSAIKVPGDVTLTAGRTQSGNINFYYAPSDNANEYSNGIDDMARRILDIRMG